MASPPSEGEASHTDDSVHTPATGPGGVVTIMHVDVEGSTALTARAGDEVGRRVLSETKAVVRERGEASGGALVDAVGDAMMLTFTSPRSAIAGAIAIQETLLEQETADPDATLRVRIGLNVGEVVEHDSTLFGAAINAGARVMAMAEGGEILVSEMVRRLAGTVPGVEYRDRGTHRFKGFDEPWRLYQVVWEGAPPPRRRAQTRTPSTRWTVAAVIIVALATAAAAFAFLRSGDGGNAEVAADSVARLDGGSGSVRLSAPVGQRPGASTIAFDSLWVAHPDRGVVTRLDLVDGTVRDTIRVGRSPSGVTADEGSVWVTNQADGTVSRINPGVNEETEKLPAGAGPTGIAFGAGALWVADTLGASLVRLDPASGETEAIPLAGRPAGVTFAQDAVWVSFDANGIARVDPRRRTVTFTKSVGSGPTAILSAFDSIWVANHFDGTVSRLDPATGRQQALVDVGEGPSSLAAAGGRLWVADEFDDSLTAIDPAKSAEDRTVFVGSSPVSLAAVGDDLWLAAGASVGEHRGGTLNVSNDGPLPETLDPGVGYDNVPWRILTMIGDGLVAYRKVGGPAGSAIVPDLASALPDVSADGLTYRFPLRQGITYSNGEPVRPEDFRRGLERAVVLSPPAGDGARRDGTVVGGLLGAVRGVEACIKAKARCDLSDSIVTDAEAVTFHLTRPDPDLPAKLASPWAFPVPAATPMTDQGLDPIPTTGPYAVAQIVGGSIRLERNPSFEEWSSAAQPDGFVDAISWRFDEEPTAAFDRLEEGAVDWVTSPPGPERISALQKTSPGQVVLTTSLSTFFVGFDVLRPPFDDVRVRRALNDAIDREKIVELWGGSTTWTLTCQVFPPGLQGYQPFCPYTVEPEAGVWSAPQLRRARALVRQAGADGAPVEFSITEFPNWPGSVEVARYVVGVMNEIGLPATLKVENDLQRYFGILYGGKVRPGSPDFPQMFVSGWQTDYVRASDTIEPNFRCDAPENVTGYCNRRLDAAIDRTKVLANTDPGAADREWTAIEHQLVRDAAWTPLVNLVDAAVFSARTGNVQIHPLWGPLLTRVWVQ